MLKHSDLLQFVRDMQADKYSYTVLADGTAVLMDIENLQVLSLNKTGSVLVQSLRNGETNTDSLAEIIAGEFSIDRETARSDTISFLEALLQQVGGNNSA